MGFDDQQKKVVPEENTGGSENRSLLHLLFERRGELTEVNIIVAVHPHVSQ